MIAPPPPQIQVQFPIIDELADEFALLIVNVKRELRSLSGSQLQDVKELVKEKLKSKGAPIALPSSADELISTISEYWNFLSFEFAKLVVQYLGKETLLTQLKGYEESLRRKAEILLTRCREKNITPRAPPGCDSMKFTVDEDPYSFSLHRILKIKDFLVYRIGVDISLFAGFHQGSIILHFCILEVDMETAVRKLNAHKLELKAMQVVTIEVGDVIVYCDAPIERASSIAAVSSKIDDLAVAMETGGPIVSRFPEFVLAVSAGVQNARDVLKEINEEIKNSLPVKSAVREVKSVVEITCGLLDKVDDVFCYGQGDAMTDAIQGLSCSPPDLKPLHNLIGLLRKLLAHLVEETKYFVLMDACNAAIHSCTEAEELCASMKPERKVTRRAVAAGVVAGGTAAATGAALAGGFTASVVAGAFTLGIGLIAGMAITAVAASAIGLGPAALARPYGIEFEEREANFKKISENFGILKRSSCDFKVVMTQVHATVERIETQINNVHSVDKESAKLMIDSLNHLKMACAASYDETTRRKDDMRKIKVRAAKI